MSELPPVSLKAQAANALRLLPYGARTDPRKYVVFAQGRTGSTLLGDLIGSHPAAMFADEILQAKVVSTRAWVEGQRRGHASKVFGFHVKIYQLTDVQGVRDPARWLRDLHTRGWRVVALRRRNLLRHVLSNMAITATGVTHHRTSDASRELLTVDPAELLHWMQQRERVGGQEREALDGVPHVALTYEDDLLDADAWPATAAGVFAHLGLDAAPVDTSLRRTNPGRLDQLVANVEEVAAALRGTPYEQFLDD
jgi:LPS sulfotransferase NodH